MRPAALLAIVILTLSEAKGKDLPAQPPSDTSATARDTTRHPADGWLGADKPKHFFLAGFTYAVAFSGARLAGLDRRPALALSLGPAALVSLGKEIRDRRVTGLFSARDLVADALGISAYAALLARTAR